LRKINANTPYSCTITGWLGSTVPTSHCFGTATGGAPTASTAPMVQVNKSAKTGSGFSFALPKFPLASGNRTVTVGA